MEKPENGEEIVLGGGCFWCIEAAFAMLDGVVRAEPGYSGGGVPDPTYNQVCGGDTGHAEVVRVEFDLGRVSLEEVLEVFFTVHDPTTPNRQGADVGTQYRSVIFTSSDEQKARVESFVDGIRAAYEQPVVTEVRGPETFWPAEEYHRDYFAKNPALPYCRVVIAPKLDKLKKLQGGGEAV